MIRLVVFSVLLCFLSSFAQDSTMVFAKKDMLKFFIAKSKEIGKVSTKSYKLENRNFNLIVADKKSAEVFCMPTDGIRVVGIMDKNLPEAFYLGLLFDGKLLEEIELFYNVMTGKEYSNAGYLKDFDNNPIEKNALIIGTLPENINGPSRLVCGIVVGKTVDNIAILTISNGSVFEKGIMYVEYISSEEMKEFRYIGDNSQN